jgi:hypothetical protein
MGAFPFTTEEWSRVGDLAAAIFNATVADDDVLRASLIEELCDVLSGLRDRYGEHPVLFETEADYAEVPAERVELYERARQIAIDGGWVTYSIRLSLARVLLEDLGESARARQELAACRDEVMECDDASTRREWEVLDAACGRIGTESA